MTVFRSCICNGRTLLTQIALARGREADSLKTNLTVDTEAANTRQSRPDSALLSAIFSSNSLKFANQVAEPKTDHNEDKLFDAIMCASSRKYDDQAARAPRRQPPHARTNTPPPSLVADSTSAVENEYETLRSIAAQRGYIRIWFEPLRPQLQQLGRTFPGLLQTVDISGEGKLATIVDHICDHGSFSDSGEVQFNLAAHKPQLDTQF